MTTTTTTTMTAQRRDDDDDDDDDDVRARHTCDTCAAQVRLKQLTLHSAIRFQHL